MFGLKERTTDMYKEWLYLTCKWATKGLEGNEFNTWQDLTTKLNKPCPYCEEGHICLNCKNRGLKLTEAEEAIIDNLVIAIHEANQLFTIHSE